MLRCFLSERLASTALQCCQRGDCHAHIARREEARGVRDSITCRFIKPMHESQAQLSGSNSLLQFGFQVVSMKATPGARPMHTWVNVEHMGSRGNGLPDGFPDFVSSLASITIAPWQLGPTSRFVSCSPSTCLVNAARGWKTTTALHPRELPCCVVLGGVTLSLLYERGPHQTPLSQCVCCCPLV